ncbi:MAG: hypothetical protein A4E55_02260 [Pelotomaculum sp. PtaU1.Bin035]|nr:MAG: hypothetical protein A4E55_02260 [Pelotomaculum sp. PtaU1.Bin035]
MLPEVVGLSDFGERIAKLEVEVEVENLNGWQKNQNGALLRVDSKVDGLKNWMLGLLGTSVLSLILLAVNLLAKK